MRNHKNLVLTNGNELQIPFILRLHQSLRARQYGDYRGDFIVVSDQLSEQSRGILSQAGIETYIFEAEKVNKWNSLLSSDKHPLGKIGKPLFITEIIDQLGWKYDNLIYMDPDILVQRPLQALINKIADNKILISSQQRTMLQTPWPVSQLRRAVDNGDVEESILTVFGPEVNTGFVAGKVDFIQQYFSEFKDFITSEKFNKYRNSDPGKSNAWHDQDYLRCFIRLRGVTELEVLNDENVIHLCSGGHEDVIVQTPAPVIRLKESEHTPILVHFAGGSINRFNLLCHFFNSDEIRLSLVQLKNLQDASNETKILFPLLSWDFKWQLWKLNNEVAQLETKYTEQETKYTEQETKYREQETKYREQETKYRELETKYKERETKCRELETEYREFETKYREQETKCRELETEYREFETKYREQEIKNKKFEADYQGLVADYQKLQQVIQDPTVRLIIRLRFGLARRLKNWLQKEDT